MGFSFTMEGKNIALETPEQIDTLIQFLHLYKTLTGNSGEAPTSDRFAAPPATIHPQTVATTEEPQHPLIPPPGQRISDFAYRVLQGTETGLHSRDLAKAMLAIGWVSRSDNDLEREQAVNTALLRYKDKFTKTPNGVWIINGVHNKPEPTPPPALTLETVGGETETE